MASFFIDEFRNEEIPEISAIHMRELPDDFLPLLGKEFLETIFYPSIHQSEYAHTLVARENNAVVGFIVITLNSGKFLASIVLKKMWGLFYTGLRYSFSGCRNFWNILEILVASLRPDKYSGLGEIYVIAVRKDKQGMGVGKALVFGAIHYLKSNGVRGIKIKTLKKNKAWINFFTNQGWVLVDEFNLIQKDYVVLSLEFSDLAV